MGTNTLFAVTKNTPLDAEIILQFVSLLYCSPQIRAVNLRPLILIRDMGVADPPSFLESYYY